MKKSVIAYLVFPMTLFGCDAVALTAIAKTSGASDAPTIIVSGSTININGKEVWLGDTLEAWKRDMPGRSRCLKPGLTAIFVWDDYGVVVGTGLIDKTRVEFINVTLALDKNPVLERQEHAPKKLFTGILQLDGVSINDTTEYGTLRSQISSHRRMGCGVRRCTEPTALLNTASEISLSLKNSSDNSRLYSFSLGCEFVDSCLALVPKAKKD